MIELLLRDARRPDGSGPVDIAVEGGRITAIDPTTTAAPR